MNKLHNESRDIDQKIRDHFYKEDEVKDSTITKFLNKFKEYYPGWKIIDYSSDSDSSKAKKRVVWELNNIMCLKENSLWWKEDEDDFISKYGCTTNYKDIVNILINYFKERV